MSMLARYKKKGDAGLMELVKLIEDSAEPKRSQLLTMVRQEDAVFAEQVLSRILTFDSIKKLPENTLAEIIALTAPKFVALAIQGETPEFIKLVERCLGKNFNEYKSEKENFLSSPPTQPQIESGQRKVLSETRKLEASGQIKLGNVGGISLPHAPASAVPVRDSSLAKKSAESAIVTGPPAQEADGCPPIESFALEAPVSGLSGERFETFLKGQLGIK